MTPCVLARSGLLLTQLAAFNRHTAVIVFKWAELQLGTAGKVARVKLQVLIEVLFRIKINTEY